MNAQRYSITQLATVTHVTTRTVRFYVRRGLLPPPQGRGRGSHYGELHRQLLEKIQQLQTAGHSLDAIQKLIQGEPTAGTGKEAAMHQASPPNKPAGRKRVGAARLYIHVEVEEGVHLQMDSARFQPTLEQLQQLQQAIKSILHGDE